MGPECGAGARCSLGLCFAHRWQGLQVALLPLLVGGGAPGPSPRSQASPWGLQALGPPPVLCWNTAEGWQGSSCTSQAGQSARGLDQGWAGGQLGRLASWGNPEAAGVGRGEGTETSGQRRGGAGVVGLRLPVGLHGLVMPLPRAVALAL